MRKISIALCLFCSIGFISFKNVGGDPIVLKLKLPVGAKFELASSVNMQTSMNMMGQDISNSNKMSFGYVFNVKSDSAGWKNIDAIFKQAGMSMSAMGMEMKYDSESSTNDSTGISKNLVKMLSMLKGSKFSFSINEKGQVSNVQGLKQVAEKMINATKSADSDPTSALIYQTISKSMSDEQLVSSLEMIFNTYPEKPVKEGDTWTKNIKGNTNGMEIKYQNIYTLVSTTGNTANVKLVSTIASKGTTATEMGNAEISMEGNGAGTIKYDISNGLPLNTSNKSNVDMKMSMQGQEIPMKMEMVGESTSKLLK